MSIFNELQGQAEVQFGAVRLSHLPRPIDRKGWPWTEQSAPIPDCLPDGNSWPRITVVVPSFRQAKYLEETLRSILLQGYPNLECMVIDGGSTDGSVDIIEAYAPFLSYWVSEPDLGQTHAINKGFARSTGEIMGWLNSDDILLPNALRRIAETFSSDPTVMTVTGFRKIYDDHSKFFFNYVRDPPTPHYLRHYCNVAQETTYWRRSVWQDLGPLDERLHFAMDYEYWLRMVEHGYNFHLMAAYTGGFRWYSENKTTSRRDLYYHDIAIIYKRYQMGSSETEILRSLGRRWKQRYHLLVDIGFKPISNNPRIVILIFNLLEHPRICAVVLAFYTRYRSFRRREGKNNLPMHEAMLRTLLTVPLHLMKVHWRLYRRRLKANAST